jgi:hypothetical protein
MFTLPGSCAKVMGILFFFILQGYQTTLAQATEKEVLVLRGATVIDLSNFGRSSNDITNAVVIIEGNKITEVGRRSKVRIPANAKIIDVTGSYILPGLIDGFATINNQSYANAFLYHGVTTIVGLPHDNRRGELFTTADPSPRIMLLEDFRGNMNFGIPNAPPAYRSKEQIDSLIDSLADLGAKVIWMGYGTQPFQLPLVVEACRRRGLVTIGEFSHSRYEEAVRAGVHSFVHTSRYSADLLPDSVRRIYNKAPFGEGSQRATAFYETISPETDSTLLRYASVIGSSETALIPTSSITYSTFPFARNPWKMPAASLIHPDSVHLPLDKETGKWKDSGWSVKYVTNLLSFDKAYYKQGAKFLVGSATDAFGTLPGISMHSELEMLVKAGLSNREALAAATTNFAAIYNWNHIGQIKKGAAADILVLSKNPTENLEYLLDIKLLLLNGKLIDRDNLLK